MSKPFNPLEIDDHSYAPSPEGTLVIVTLYSGKRVAFIQRNVPSRGRYMRWEPLSLDEAAAIIVARQPAPSALRLKGYRVNPRYIINDTDDELHSEVLREEEKQGEWLLPTAQRV